MGNNFEGFSDPNLLFFLILDAKDERERDRDRERNRETERQRERERVEHNIDKKTIHAQIP
jgi:hypothetical protein